MPGAENLKTLLRDYELASEPKAVRSLAQRLFFFYRASPAARSRS